MRFRCRDVLAGVREFRVSERNARHYRITWVFVAFLASFISGCSGLLNQPVTQPTAQKPVLGDWGVETQLISKDIHPGDDFYRYVNKGWLDTATIPPGLPRNGAFVELSLRTEDQLKAIVADLQKHPAATGSAQQQVADFHASFMDVARRNQLGISMLQPELDRILKARTRKDIAQLMGRVGYQGIVNVGVLRDPGNPYRYILALGQSGLGLPAKEYYLSNQEPFVSHRGAYKSYIEGVLERAGVAKPGKRAKDILAFETAMAKRHWDPSQVRDILKNYHLMTLRQLMYYAPGFNWTSYFEAEGFPDAKEVVVSTDTAIKGSAAVFARTSMDTLRAYTAFHYLNNLAPYLSEDWSDAHFQMFSRQLAGIPEQRPLDARAIERLNGVLGEQLGKLYVERYFAPSAKAQMVVMVRYIRQAFRERLEKNDWMDEETRQEAFAKLDSFSTKIGFPDRWHDFRSIEIRADDLVGNVLRMQEWYRKDDQEKLSEPIRTWEWSMTPQTVNAYYSPGYNEIVFPAAILQSPFFDEYADPAVNFGAIGTVIGHEMGHAFDDQGSRYDSTGLLRNWWGKESRDNFDKLTLRLVDQYNRYTPMEGVHVNGRLTLGENIGDLGGIAVAYTAYQKYVETELQGRQPVLDGFTGNQRFFLGYGQLWRYIATPDFIHQMLLSDPHSPGEFRINGILRNFDPWYTAFWVTPRSALYLPESVRVQIW